MRDARAAARRRREHKHGADARVLRAQRCFTPMHRRHAVATPAPMPLLTPTGRYARDRTDFAFYPCCLRAILLTRHVATATRSVNAILLLFCRLRATYVAIKKRLFLPSR